MTKDTKCITVKLKEIESQIAALSSRIKIFGVNPEDERVGNASVSRGKSPDTSAPRAESPAGSEEARRLFRAFREGKRVGKRFERRTQYKQRSQSGRWQISARSKQAASLC